MVVGACVGAFLFILIVSIGVACCIRRKKQRDHEKNAMDHLWETNPTIQVYNTLNESPKIFAQAYQDK